MSNGDFEKFIEQLALASQQDTLAAVSTKCKLVQEFYSESGVGQGGLQALGAMILDAAEISA